MAENIPSLLILQKINTQNTSETLKTRQLQSTDLGKNGQVPE